MSTLEGRVALITGASGGIGAAAAQLLAGQGARVALASRRGSDLGIDGALAQSCDVREPEQLQAIVAATVERFGGLDIVVANAGVGAYGDFIDLDAQHLEEIVDVNFKGLLYTVRAALPHLLESDVADLVVVASIAGQRGPEGEAVYAASKFAQVGFMRSFDHEMYRRGVRCSTLCPGGVATEFAMGRGRTPEDPDLADMMRPEEVADAILHAVTRPRTHRVLEASLLPMSDDSLG
ncbi:MAG: SDR family oxidoreductase [Actinomycetota bacterium]|nr:SDR family oxidoreductase [Actinomycetota bacterium]